MPGGTTARLFCWPPSPLKRRLGLRRTRTMPRSRPPRRRTTPRFGRQPTCTTMRFRLRWRGGPYPARHPPRRRRGQPDPGIRDVGDTKTLNVRNDRLDEPHWRMGGGLMTSGVLHHGGRRQRWGGVIENEFGVDVVRRGRASDAGQKLWRGPLSTRLSPRSRTTESCADGYPRICAVERHRLLVRPGWAAIGTAGDDCRARND